MAITINWVEPSNTNVGSVLIYRSDDAVSESLGSRIIIDTIAAKSGDEWVVSYTDTTGNSSNLYRIQFWDGVGSSIISDVIGQQYNELLADFEDVRRIAKIRNNDLGSEDIYYAIKDATDVVYDDVGDPIKQSYIYIDSETGVDGQVYDFTGDLGPVYQIREIYVDSCEPEIVSGTSYDIDYANGNIKFTDNFIGSYQGKYVIVNWVPMTYHILIKTQAALDLVEGEFLFSGTDTPPPRVEKLRKKIENTIDTIRPKGIFSTKSDNILHDYDVIGQKIKRKSIYFNK